MREFLSILWVSFALCMSLVLNGIGSVFSAAGNMAHIYFRVTGHRHDLKYSPKQPEAQAAKEPTNVFELVHDKEMN